MKPQLINAGVYLYRDHYIIKNVRGDARAWDCFPMEDGVTLHKCKSRADAVRQIDGFFKCARRNPEPQGSLL